MCSSDLKLFANMAEAPAFRTPDDIPFTILLPAFVTSELKTAFQIGFMIFLPFLIIDLVVASTLMALGMMMLSAFFAVLGVIGLVLLLRRSRRKLPPTDEAYLKFCHLLARQGLERRVGEAPGDYARRVIEERPELKASVDEVTALYVGLNYSGDVEDSARLKRAVRQFQVRNLTT